MNFITPKYIFWWFEHFNKIFQIDLLRRQIKLVSGVPNDMIVWRVVVVVLVIIHMYCLW